MTATKKVSRRALPAAVITAVKESTRATQTPALQIVKLPPAPRAQATKAANTAAPIDFDQPREPGTFTGGRASPWVNKVKELVAGVIAGRGHADEFYRLGVFGAASGARTTIRNLARHEQRLGLPDGVQVTFEVEGVTNADGTRGSELWAAVHKVNQVSSPN